MKNPKIKPWEYQQECLAAIDDVIAQGEKRALVVMTSGLGKTYTAAFAIEKFLVDKRFARVLILCHSEKILRQTKGKFKRYFGEGYSYGMYVDRDKTIRPTDFLFATFQTMKDNRKNFPKDEFAYVVVDEAHHSHARTYFPTIRYFQADFLLGLTATPDRLDGQKIEEIYGEPVYELGFVEATQRGLIAPCDYRLVLDDLSQEKLDEYLASDEKLSIKQLNRTLFIEKRDAEIVRLIGKYSAEVEDPKMMIFCRTIEHARKIAKLMGDKAAVVHDRNGDAANDRALAAFKAGKVNTVISVDMLNEGIDVPDANIVVFLRNTVSPAVFYQQLGRGTRRSPDKDKVLVLDFVNNCERIKMILELKQEIDDFAAFPPHDEDGTHGDGNADVKEKFTLNIATPEFQARVVDIVELLNRAANGLTWTDEELIQAIQKKANELGRAPTITEFNSDPRMPYGSTVTKRFGSWAEAIIVAGFEPEYRQYTAEELIQNLQTKASELGHTPSINDCDNDPKMPSSTVFAKRFGSWNNALKAASLLVIREHHYTRAELIDALKRKVNELNRAPSQNEMRADKDMPSIGAYANHFGSWQAALDELNLRMLKQSSYSRDELIVKLQQKALELGHNPTVDDFQADATMPSRDTYLNHFGNWKKALQAANLPVTGISIHAWSQEELIGLLQQKAKELGRTPQRREIDDDKSMPSTNTFKRIFGGWTNAVKAADLTPTREARQPSRKSWSDEALLQLLRTKAEQLGRTPSKTDIDNSEDVPNSSVFSNRFGGWNAALEKAGLSVRKRSQSR